MSKKVIIASDSTTDLGPELMQRYQVKMLSLGVNLGGKLYTDGVDIDPDFIYNHYEQTGELPKTSAINIAEFTAFFKEQTDAKCSRAFHHQFGHVLHLRQCSHRSRGV